MKQALRSLGRFGLGLLLLFLGSALAWAALDLPRRGGVSTGLALAFLAGFAGGLLFFGFVCACRPFYVFGHELTHWFAAKLCLRRTGKFRVGLESGSVAVENPNMFIILAPYFVPFYTLVWIGGFGIWRFSQGGVPGWTESFLLLAGIGCTAAQHVVLTVQALRVGQADLNFHGRFLSLAFILFGNILMVFGGLTVASGEYGRAARLASDKVLWQWRAAAAAARFCRDTAGRLVSGR